MPPIENYFDANSTAPLCEAARSFIAENETLSFANPNSIHSYGVEARLTLERARRKLARLINAESPDCIIFTSGATEAINLAIRGTRGAVNQVVYTAADHAAVIATAQAVAQGETTALPVDSEARLMFDEINLPERGSGCLLNVILANNEVGSINDIPLIRQHCTDALLHVDAAQAIGRIPVDVQALAVDLLSATFHKIGGPKGVGFLYRRSSVSLDPQITGGGQEAGLRSGTENVLAIGAAVAALEESIDQMQERTEQYIHWREMIWSSLSKDIDGAQRNSPAKESLPNTLNLSFDGVAGRELCRVLSESGFAISPGSACSSAGNKPSHVLLAMGHDQERAAGAVRISLGPWNTSESVDALTKAMKAAVFTIRPRLGKL